jgi:plasmid stability protein
MASLTIRNLDDRLKKKLRMRAARYGRSMEEEARQILATGLSQEATAASNVADAIAAIVDPIGGLQFDVPKRAPVREPPRNWPDRR